MTRRFVAAAGLIQPVTRMPTVCLRTPAAGWRPASPWVTPTARSLSPGGSSRTSAPFHQRRSLEVPARDLDRLLGPGDQLPGARGRPPRPNPRQPADRAARLPAHQRCEQRTDRGNAPSDREDPPSRPGYRNFHNYRLRLLLHQLAHCPYHTDQRTQSQVRGVERPCHRQPCDSWRSSRLSAARRRSNPADPVQRVVAVPASAQGLPLHAAADLVDGGVSCIGVRKPKRTKWNASRTRTASGSSVRSASTYPREGSSAANRTCSRQATPRH
jgi:hypothetical protein